MRQREATPQSRLYVIAPSAAEQFAAIRTVEAVVIVLELRSFLTNRSRLAVLRDGLHWHALLQLVLILSQDIHPAHVCNMDPVGARHALTRAVDRE